MKKFTLFLAFTLLTACQAVPVSHQSFVDNPANVQHLQRSTVSVLRRNALDGQLEGPVCTAFFVSPKLLATAYHCLDLVQVYNIELAPGLSIEINVPVNEEAVGSTLLISTREQYERFGATDGNVILYYEATVVAASEEHDLALVEAPEYYESNDWLPLSTYPVHAGETVYGMGMPANLPWVLTRGMISSVLLTGQGNILHQAPVSPGASGGPLINDFGQLVGVNVGYMQGARLASVAVPVRYLQELIDTYRQ